jgi:hypothetical protein
MEGMFARTILAHIRSPLVRMESPVTEFEVLLMGGQYLPTLDQGGVVSPYCIVSIHGVSLCLTLSGPHLYLHVCVSPASRGQDAHEIQHDCDQRFESCMDAKV